MYQAGKVHNAARKMSRHNRGHNMGIMGISEMRRPGSGHCEIDDHQVYYSGRENGEHQHGVGAIIRKDITRYITNFVPISQRCMLLQINARPSAINIIQVYAPTLDSSEAEFESFYDVLWRTRVAR